MPIHEASLPGGGKGWQWGEHGKVYGSRAGAERQAATAHAHGYTGDEAPKRAAGVALRDPQGRMLFVRRTGARDNADTWAFPGGMVEGDETPLQTAVRELKEETGYDANGKFGVMDPGRGVGAVDFATFVHDVGTHFTPTLNDEHDGFIWATPDKAPAPLHPGVKAALARDASQKAISDLIAAEIRKGHDPKQAAAIAYNELGEDMEAGDWRGLVDGLLKFLSEEAREPEHRGAFDQAIEFSRHLGAVRSLSATSAMALDRDSSRTYDRDGRMRVADNNISKATVNEYYGREIPNAVQLGLEPLKKYRLLRDPEELRKAAPTFNNLPLLSRHVPTSAVAHPSDLVIGALGTDARFDHPHLKNSLMLWRHDGIGDVLSNTKTQLSAGYHYRADMTPGEYEGQPYDGVMRDIVGNHVTLVREGRAGDDVVVGDSAIPQPHEVFNMKTTVLTRFGAVTQGALMAYLLPKMAQDSKYDLGEALAGVTSKNFPEKKAGILEAIKKGVKLAPNMALDDMPDVLDKVGKVEVAEGADTDPNSGLPMSAEELKKKIGADAETEEERKAREAKTAADKKAHDEAVNAFRGKLGAEDRKAFDAIMGGPPEFEGKPSPAMDAAIDAAVKKATTGMVTQQAMDAAITGVRTANHAVQVALRDVRPWVGELTQAFDSADDVYKAALTSRGVKIDGVHASAFKAILHAQPKPGQQRQVSEPLALDAAASKDFAERFPGAAKINIL